MKIESYITQIIEGKKRTLPAKGLLRMMSSIYRAGSSLHRYGYETILSQTKLNLPVVSVGNIVAGGSGKTPFVQYLAQKLAPRKVAILSRGYKRKSKETLVVTEEMSADECGDEPKLLKSKLSGVSIIVGKDRSYSGHLATMLDAEIIILDDGLQHHKLKRNIEIITMDAHNLFGKGHFLPYGYLRDDPKVLKSAHLIVLTAVEDEKHFEEVTKELQKWTPSPISSMKAIYENSGEIAGKTIGAFCAIARPMRFLKTLKDLGCTTVESILSPDHDPFSHKDLEDFAIRAQAKGAEALVCTEKDAIKWSQLPKTSLPIIPLKMSLKPQFGKEHIEKLIHGV